VPIQNLRLAPTVLSSYHTIAGVAGLDDRRQLGFDGFSFDARYRIVDRSRWGLGLTVNAEPHWGLVDDRHVVCAKCGGRGNKIDVRPNWKEQPSGPSLVGKEWR
jgi:hypothetical protein